MVADVVTPLDGVVGRRTPRGRALGGRRPVPAVEVELGLGRAGATTVGAVPSRRWPLGAVQGQGEGPRTPAGLRRAPPRAGGVGVLPQLGPRTPGTFVGNGERRGGAGPGPPARDGVDARRPGLRSGPPRPGAGGLEPATGSPPAPPPAPVTSWRVPHLSLPRVAALGDAPVRRARSSRRLSGTGLLGPPRVAILLAAAAPLALLLPRDDLVPPLLRRGPLPVPRRRRRAQVLRLVQPNRVPRRSSATVLPLLVRA